MNLKRWFLWLCLAVIVVGEVMLFQANQKRDAAIVARDTAQHDADKARKDLDQFQASAAAAQGAEGDRLRRENQNLSQALTQLRTETNRLQKANQQLTQQLAALGVTAQQQQAQLQQWDAATRQARTVVQQAQSQAETDRLACMVLSTSLEELVGGHVEQTERGAVHTMPCVRRSSTSSRGCAGWPTGTWRRSAAFATNCWPAGPRSPRPPPLPPFPGAVPGGILPVLQPQAQCAPYRQRSPPGLEAP